MCVCIVDVCGGVGVAIPSQPGGIREWNGAVCRGAVERGRHRRATVQSEFMHGMTTTPSCGTPHTPSPIHTPSPPPHTPHPPHHTQVTGKCSRCRTVCVDQTTGDKTSEPLHTLMALHGSKVGWGRVWQQGEVGEGMSARWGGGRYGSKVGWGRVCQQGEVGEGMSAR